MGARHVSLEVLSSGPARHPSLRPGGGSVYTRREVRPIRSHGLSERGNTRECRNLDID